MFGEECSSKSRSQGLLWGILARGSEKSGEVYSHSAVQLCPVNVIGRRNGRSMFYGEFFNVALDF